MFLTEFDEEAYRKAMRSEGYEEGYEEGHDKGYKEGHGEGYEEGHDEGYEEGRDEGQEEYNHLITALMESNRMEDLRRAVKDKAFRKQLFHEFGIAK